jgi:signal transduction histidine kinase
MNLAEGSVLPDRTDANTTPLKPGWIGLAAISLVFMAVVARTLAIESIRPLLTQYLGLELVYLALFSALLIKTGFPGWLLHLYFVLQSALVLYTLSLWPEFDFIIVLFLLLCYQASLLFTGRMRWIWVFALVGLTGGSMIFYMGFFRGLALSLTTMAGEIVIPAFLIVNQEIEIARAESQILIDELEQTHRQLELYSTQVEELAAVQERNRLARELHDTISQLIFSISLTTRSAQLLLEMEPTRVSEQLIRLQEMSADALSQLRSFIKQLRPPQKS